MLQITQRDLEHILYFIGKLFIIFYLCRNLSKFVIYYIHIFYSRRLFYARINMLFLPGSDISVDV